MTILYKCTNIYLSIKVNELQMPVNGHICEDMLLMKGE